MRRIHWLVAGLALAIGAGALAQVVPGGLPSFPRFLGLTITNYFNCNKSGHVAGEGCQLVTNGTGITSQNYVGIYDQGGTRYGYFGKAGTSDATITFDSDGPLKLTGNNGTDSAIIDTSHKFTYNGGTIAYSGISNPRVAFGEFIATAGGCSLNSGVWDNAGFSASCTRNSTGIYTATFSNTFTGSPASPICLANATSSTAGAASVNTAGSTSVTVSTVNTAFAVADIGAFFVACFGH